MVLIKQYPPQSEVRQYFDYEPSDPVAPLVKKVSKVGPKRKAAPRSTFISVRMDGQRYVMHRLVWIYHHGDIPEGMEIDHIDRQTHNNVIDNLRCVSRADNGRNRATYCTTGLRGTYMHGGKLAVRITLPEGGMKYIGRATTRKEAARMYDDAMAAYYGQDHTFPRASEDLTTRGN